MRRLALPTRLRRRFRRNLTEYRYACTRCHCVRWSSLTLAGLPHCGSGRTVGWFGFTWKQERGK